MKDEWQLEMDHMLDLFEHESELSLRKINQRFEVLDRPFNDEFRQYFMKMSAHRLDTSFTKIEMERWDNSQISNGGRARREVTPDCNTFARGGRGTVNAHSSEGGDIHLIVKSENVIEITDSDDEDDRIQAERSNGMQSGNSVEKNATNNINRNGEVSNCVVIIKDSNSHGNQMIESDGDESMVRNGEISKSNISIEVQGDALLKSESMDEEENIPFVTFDPNLHSDQSEAKNGGSKRQLSPLQTAANNRLKRGGGERFKCEHCESSFHFKSRLRVHQQIHANGKFIGVNADSNGLYHCTHCVRKFTNVSNINRHMKSHKNNQHLHYCVRCMRPFGRNAEKKRHESQCKGRHYECHLCKVYVTRSKAQLRVHMRKHSGAKPFRCLVCSKSFQQKSYLRCHLNSIHSRTNQ